LLPVYREQEDTMAEERDKWGKKASEEPDVEAHKWGKKAVDEPSDENESDDDTPDVEGHIYHRK